MISSYEESFQDLKVFVSGRHQYRVDRVLSNLPFDIRAHTIELSAKPITDSGDKDGHHIRIDGESYTHYHALADYLRWAKKAYSLYLDKHQSGNLNELFKTAIQPAL